MGQDFGMLLMGFALFGLFALNALTVGLMVRRNRRFLRVIRGMQASSEVSMHH
ncbi:MAG: hypothetical protein M1546_11835 [Chloroflexi bacterium]|nr:hypothetical protein [Chloroflexota bacterium]